MVTAKQTWIGFVVLFLVMVLVVVAAIYWQHVTGTNFFHQVVSSIPLPFPSVGGQGC